MSDIKTNITINVVEPVDSTNNTNTDETNETNSLIVTQDTDINVPDTGLFTHGIGVKEVAVLSTAIFIILTIVASLSLHYSKKHGKVTKLTKLFTKYKQTLKTKKHVTISLSILTLLVSIGTLAGLLRLGVNAIDPIDNTNSNSSSNESTNDKNSNNNNSSTTITTDNIDIIEASLEDGEVEIPLGDKPVFAKIPVTITVDEAMPAGYTIKAYAENPDFTSTNEDNTTITMVTPIDDVADSLSLTDNTWGLSIESPNLPTDNIFYSLPQPQDNATILTDSDYEETEANSTFTFYYNIYLTPDLPYGTYTGASISYDIEQNRTDLAKVTFDGNGLYFNGDPEQTTNAVRYIPATETSQTIAYSHTPNLNSEGEQNGFYGDNLDVTNVYSFASDAVKLHIEIIKSGNASGCGPSDSEDYFSFWSGKHPDYTAKSNYSSSILAFNNTDGKYVFGDYNGVEIDMEGSSVTFSYTTNDEKTLWCPDAGYGYYAAITAQDADGNDVGLVGNELYLGEYLVPASDKPHKFLGWSVDKNVVVPSFVDETDISSSLDLTNDEATVYAIWQEGIEIIYSGNGADADIDMNNVEQHGYVTDLATANLQVGLLAPNFKRQGYGFVGWSTDTEAWEHLIDNDDTNNPTIYGPNQTITIDENLIAEAGENRKLILNAVWAPAEKDNNGNPISLQNWTGCSNLTAAAYDSETGILTVGKNTVTALTDNRDGNIYTVARLVDGNCWMTENLRLADMHIDENGEIQPTVLTSANTNNPYINQLSSSSNNWCDSHSSACINKSYLDSSNTTDTIVSPILSQDFTSGRSSYNDLNGNIYSYGNYYNWYSATAGKGTYAMTSGNASGDICPAGWHLPYGGKNDINGGFEHLDRLIGGGRHTLFPINFSDAGRGYWSSTVAGGYSYKLRLAHFASNNGLGDAAEFVDNLVRCVMNV